jgi:Integrase core domain
MGGRTGPAPDFSQHLWYRAHSSVPDSLLAAAAAAADPPRTEKLGRIAGIGHRITGRRSGMINRHRGIGSEYLHVAVDDASCLAYTEILPDERKASTIAFLEALAWFARHGATVERIMTDHGNAYRSHDFRAACARASVRHLRTKPDTPRPARPAHHPARPFLPTSPPSAANGAPRSDRRPRSQLVRSGDCTPQSRRERAVKTALSSARYGNKQTTATSAADRPPGSRT